MEYYRIKDIKIRISRIEYVELLKFDNPDYIPEIKNDIINIESMGDEIEYGIEIGFFSGKSIKVFDTEYNIKELFEELS